MKKRSTLRLYLIFIALYVPLCVLAQDSGPNPYEYEFTDYRIGEQQVKNDSLVYLKERVLLHFANESLTKNETLFFKAYILTGVENRMTDLSGVLNVELLDSKGTIVQKQYHRVVDGMVDGQLELPRNIEAGKYKIKAYTRWMKNFGQDSFTNETIWVGDKSNNIPAKDQSSNVLIIPEGGNILSGHNNRIIVKLPNQSDMGPQEIGKIVDSQNNKVSTLHYYANGMGTSLLEAEQNETYRLLLNNGDTYALPLTSDQGYAMSVNNLEKDKAKIRVTASKNMADMQVKLVGTMKGITYLENDLDLTGNQSLDFEISKKDLPGGILELSLVDLLGNELARRPLWIDGPQLFIDVIPLNSNTSEFAYKVKVTDKNNEPVKTKMALSVKRYTVLNKEEIPAQIFETSDIFSLPSSSSWSDISEDRKFRFLRDLNLLLVNYGIDNEVADKKIADAQFQYTVQKGLELSGYAYDLNNKLLANTKIQIIAQSDEEIWINEMETNDDGLLNLKNIQVNGDAKLVFRTKGKKTTSRLVKIKLLNASAAQKSAANDENSRKIKEKRTNKRQPQQVMDTTGLIKLDEVELSEDKSKKELSFSKQYGLLMSPQRIKFQDPDRPKTLPELLSEIPGVTVSGIGTGEPRVAIPRAWGPILWVIDGLPLIQPNTGQTFEAGLSNPLFEVMSLVPDRDIDRIELLLGPEGAIYGSRASGGVVHIYTRTGNSKTISRKEGQMDFQGYTSSVDFGTYLDNLSKREKSRSSILYWDSNVETDEKGEAIIRFPKSTEEESVLIEVSTVSPEGQIGSTSVTF